MVLAGFHRVKVDAIFCSASRANDLSAAGDMARDACASSVGNDYCLGRALVMLRTKRERGIGECGSSIGQITHMVMLGSVA